MKISLKNFLLFVIVSSFSILFNSCTKERLNKRLFQSCCQTNALSATVGEGSFSIPNVFSPNQDAINDVLVIIADDYIDRATSFIVRNDTGELVFKIENAEPDNNNIIWVWNGKNLQGNLVVGVFEYEVVVTSGNTTESFKGMVCSIVCDKNNLDIRQLPVSDHIRNCAFSRQSNQGVFDLSLPSGELFDQPFSCGD